MHWYRQGGPTGVRADGLHVPVCCPVQSRHSLQMPESPGAEEAVVWREQRTRVPARTLRARVCVQVQDCRARLPGHPGRPSSDKACRGAGLSEASEEPVGHGETGVPAVLATGAQGRGG